MQGIKVEFRPFGKSVTALLPELLVQAMARKKSKEDKINNEKQKSELKKDEARENSKIRKDEAEQ